MLLEVRVSDVEAVSGASSSLRPAITSRNGPFVVTRQSTIVLDSARLSARASAMAVSSVQDAGDGRSNGPPPRGNRSESNRTQATRRV